METEWVIYNAHHDVSRAFDSRVEAKRVADLCFGIDWHSREATEDDIKWLDYVCPCVCPWAGYTDIRVILNSTGRRMGFIAQYARKEGK